MNVPLMLREAIPEVYVVLVEKMRHDGMWRAVFAHQGETYVITVAQKQGEHASGFDYRWWNAGDRDNPHQSSRLYTERWRAFEAAVREIRAKIG